MPSNGPQQRERISTFEELIAPMPTDEFLKDAFGKRPLYVHGSADRFNYLLTWAALNSILSKHPIDGLNILLAKDGQSIPAKNYLRPVNIEFLGQHRQLNIIEVTKLFREGATLTLDLYREVHEPIRTLADIVERAVFSRVHVVVFAGWHSAQAFPTHWDSTDIFVLQICGRKHWRVLEPTRKHPTFEDKQIKLEAPSKLYWEGDLNSGDLLHIPRGWWHDARPYSEPSLHLTFVVKPATGVDLAEEILSRLKELEFIRANIPRYATTAEQVDYVEAFRSELNSAAAGISLTSFLGKSDSMMPLKGRLSLPWSAAPQSQPLPEMAQLEWCPIHLFNITVSDQTMSFEILGSTIIFQRSIEPIIRDFITHKATTLKSLQLRHPTLDVKDSVMLLISNGLVVVVAPDDGPDCRMNPPS